MFFLFLFVSSTGPGSKESIENAEPEQLPTLQSQFCEKDPVEKKKKNSLLLSQPILQAKKNGEALSQVSLSLSSAHSLAPRSLSLSFPE